MNAGSVRETGASNSAHRITDEHITLLESDSPSAPYFFSRRAYGMWFPNRIVLLAFLFPVRVRHVIVFLIVAELLQAMESTGEGIAYAAHLGGMAFGYVYLRWWSKGGLGLGALPGLHDVKRAYYRWRFRRLQKKRFGKGPTLH